MTQRTFSDTPEPRFVERAKTADNAGEASPESLVKVIKPSAGISADISEDGKSLEIHIDLTGSAVGKIFTINAQGKPVWLVPTSMFDELISDSVISKTLVSDTPVEFVGFNSTDNHWHIANSKVDDTFTIDGELELGETGDLGSHLQAEIKSVVGIPNPPIENGTYKLQLVVAGGVATITWVAA